VKRHLAATGTAVLVIAAALAGVGAYAGYTGTASQAQSVASGTVTVALGAGGASTNRLSVTVPSMVIGATIYRGFDLNVSGTADLASVTLTTSFSPSSILNTDATDGLHIVIDKCSVAWTEAGTSPDFTYSCGGTTTSVLASRAIAGTSIALSNLTLTAGATNHLRLSVSLPGPATSVLGWTSTCTWSFNATQRTAGSH
jgi:spore coat-associated protein N